MSKFAKPNFSTFCPLPPYFGRKRLAWVRELLTFDAENALDLIELFYACLYFAFVSGNNGCVETLC